MRGIAASLLAAVLGAAALFAAGRMHGPLVEQRAAAGLLPGDDPLENAPPLIAFTHIALGGFRGIAADLLWLRAIEMQDRGQFIELVTLADWITKLQPRMPAIWSFQAWNLAFNVSVMFERPEDRWRWVQHGIRLLRDEGLRYCPGQPRLYEELVWLFFFKIGEDLDEAHRHYKREWAREMERVLGGGRPDFDALATAPATREALLRDGPARAWVESMTAAGLDPWDARWLDPAHGPAGWRARADGDPGGRTWLLHLRARELTATYKMPPDKLRAVDAEFGPFDWRLPDAHAVYWATQGLPFARTAYQQLSLQRRRYQSLSAAFLRGRLVGALGDGDLALSPNLDLLPAVRRDYETAIAQNPHNETVRTAYNYFYQNAIVIAFSYNRLDLTRRLYADYRDTFPELALPPDMETFVAFAYNEYIEGMNPGQATAAVESALYQSLLWRALGDEDQAVGFERIAMLIWEHWMGDRTDPRLRARVGLPPLPMLRQQAADRVRDDLPRYRPREGTGVGGQGSGSEEVISDR